jgi:hypothetical protein
MIASESHTTIFPSCNDGHLPAGEKRNISAPEFSCARGDHDFVEGDAEMAHQNPWPERPGRIAFVGDDENGLHSRGRQLLRL